MGKRWTAETLKYNVWNKRKWEGISNQTYKLACGCVMQGLACTGEKTEIRKQNKISEIREKDAEGTGDYDNIRQWNIEDSWLKKGSFGRQLITEGKIKSKFTGKIANPEKEIANWERGSEDRTAHSCLRKRTHSHTSFSSGGTNDRSFDMKDEHRDHLWLILWDSICLLWSHISQFLPTDDVCITLFTIFLLFTNLD